ncbi:MAG: hypothetical protein P8L85_16695 [Rubripirellula sp.]|nr:hypothetical protein [Rubripirellula sp.]
MPEHEVNPYRPPETGDLSLDESASVSVTLANDARSRRIATNQYLLRWHPKRLFFGSVLIIGVSTLCIHYSIRVGFPLFALTMIAVMALSSLAYAALVWRAKSQIAEAFNRSGLSLDEPYTLRADAEEFQFVTAHGVLCRWPYGQIQVHRTSRGVLISPEPLLFFLIPKHHDAHLEETGRFVQAVQLHVEENSQDQPVS